MRKILIIFAMILVSDFAKSACNSPISRTNFSSNQVLTSTRLNTELNTVYSRANELPGDCITDETITSAKIASGTIVNADISPTAAIARTKLGALNYQMSPAVTTANTTSLTPVDIPNLSVSLNATGALVEIAILEGDPAYGSSPSIGGTGSGGTIQISRGATVICKFGVLASADFAPTALRCIDTPVAGTYTYKAQYFAVASSSVSVINLKMLVREL